MTIYHHPLRSFSIGYFQFVQRTRLVVRAKASTDIMLHLHLLHIKCSNEDYGEGAIMFESAAFLVARRLIRIFDKALLVLIGRLAADEVGKTWLYRVMSLAKW
jgi:hypothetical protein